jgi:hypothetical protein
VLCTEATYEPSCGAKLLDAWRQASVWGAAPTSSAAPTSCAAPTQICRVPQPLPPATQPTFCRGPDNDLARRPLTAPASSSSPDACSHRTQLSPPCPAAPLPPPPSAPPPAAAGAAASPPSVPSLPCSAAAAASAAAIAAAASAAALATAAACAASAAALATAASCAAVAAAWAAGRPASHRLLAYSLPSASNTENMGGSHALTSSVQLRTFDTCTPSCRCTPLHSMHSSTPRFRLAQSGSAAPQSTHRRLPGTRRSRSSVPPPPPSPRPPWALPLPPPSPTRAPSREAECCWWPDGPEGDGGPPSPPALPPPSAPATGVPGWLLTGDRPPPPDAWLTRLPPPPPSPPAAAMSAESAWLPARLWVGRTGTRGRLSMSTSPLSRTLMTPWRGEGGG